MKALEQLLTGGDVARLLGVSKQRLQQLRQQDGFPEPIARVGNYPVWRGVDVERWIGKQRPTAGLRRVEHEIRVDRERGAAPESAPKTPRSRSKS